MSNGVIGLTLIIYPRKITEQAVVLEAKYIKEIKDAEFLGIIANLAFNDLLYGKLLD